jgi:3-hydroxyacyl-CoA dehydrogenase/enoyl-CoA hydratase/3-hydroxybutyryl-CoA epimerase
MTYQNFTLETDADGIALLTWDMPDKSVNVITQTTLEDLDALVDEIIGNDEIKGAVFTSAKPVFCMGADLTMMETFTAEAQKEAASGAVSQEILAKTHERLAGLSKLLRKMELGKKSVVAALNGSALGGGFELALACHHRVAAINPKARFGLPESRVGLIPGGGGTQRLARLLGAQESLQMMLLGKTVDPVVAQKAGLIDELVPADELIGTAKKWIQEGGKAQAPWDVKGFRIPGGLPYSKGGVMTFTAANAIYRRETYDNYPAQRAILSCVYEGLLVNMDTALSVEARYFTHVVLSPVAKQMIRTLFISMQELNKGARRPKDQPKTDLKKIGVLGAGMMGAGIAYVSSYAGLEVVLLDRDQEAADKGKSLSDKLMDKRVRKGRVSADDKTALLERITATDDYAKLKGCDLVIEAVFEDRDIKADVTKKSENVLGKDAIFASNTSTLPITSLAEASRDPSQFIGIHFFSPVEKMMLVEIIMGKKTGDKALSTALDYVARIKKTPIVVNDSRGFYTTRVVSTYITEGLAMLADGVPAAMVENVGRMTGMPVGPLSLNDEVSLDLAYKIAQATKKDMGDAYQETPGEGLIEEMVVKRERFGRKNGKGFYDYPEKGKKHLWPDLHQILPEPQNADELDVEDLKTRFLTIQALETARCFDEEVITDVRDADVGAILGWGFAPFTGGPLSYIDSLGAKEFVAQCEALEKTYGPRFAPCKLLKDMAKKSELFYTRFAPPKS